MNFNRLIQAWGRVSRREQQLLLGLAGLLLVVVAYTSIWQPTRQRLEVAERQYRQQAELHARIQRADPPRDLTTATRPLSVRVNDSASAAGLDIAEMEVDGDSLRLVVSGDANSLLHWLDQREQEGAALQSLTLEARDRVLEARVVLRQ
ncbi:MULTISPECIES: type II secretion system protein GspM [Pseudomonas]|jgi:general secretion pathway protein M|uniref:type II secretion system protein GspM n=1 Tax=Pseudomonas TaxID=286 RepID=UPI000D6D953C|nr:MULTISPECIES: type II secretion system protein GspM [Pseudomonas]MCD9117923.1 type II secretion system protein M [Pseudomonas bijieensis]PWJ40487.1 general secretion pathway protein M [Pseudomonas sp. 43mfcvi1.1]WLH63438.1 type II secretion system protein GspM [Pseudomonas sp. FP2300]SSB95152.1 general secretion pathway protein M [Pseudomonas sp. 43mfcvi1.1]BBH30945.1 protein GspM [Pseudomonas sp. St290]